MGPHSHLHFCALYAPRTKHMVTQDVRDCLIDSLRQGVLQSQAVVRHGGLTCKQHCSVEGASIRARA